MDELTQCLRRLGMDHGGSADELRAAYEELQDVWDPQRFAHDSRLLAKARERLAEITRAYEFLQTQMAAGGVYPGREASAGDSIPVEPTIVAVPEPELETGSVHLSAGRRLPRRGWLRAAAASLLLLVGGGILWQRNRRESSTGLLGVEEAAAGVKLLFDGHSTAGWRGYGKAGFPSASWRIVKGTLQTLADGEPVDLVTAQEYENFDLQFEWQVADDGSGGVLYRVSEDLIAAGETGWEMVLRNPGRQAESAPNEAAGSLAGLLAPAPGGDRAAGEWNQGRIIVQGNHVEHWVNGISVLEYEIGGPVLQELLKQGRYKNMTRFGREAKGRIALRHAKAAIAFRNLKLRELAGP